MDIVDYTQAEINCQKATQGTSFVQGLQSYIFSIGTPSVFIPSASYFLMNVTVEGAAATVPPNLNESLALVEGAANSAYQSAYFLAAGQVVDSVVNYLPQTAMLKMRTSKSKAWIDSIGASAHADNGTFTRRSEAISSRPSSTDNDNMELIRRASALGAVATAGLAASGVNGIAAVVFVAAADGTIDSVVEGDVLVIAGARYTANGNNTVVSANTGAVAGVADYYILRRKTTRTYKVKNQLQIVFRPPLGIFDNEDPLGPGQYEFQLNPSAAYKTLMMESTKNVTNRADGAVGAANTYQVTVNNVRFYACIAKCIIPDSIQSIYLNEFFTQSKQMTSNNMNFSFSVPPSTNTLYCFLQATGAGTGAANSQYPVSRFITGANDDLSLSTILVTYANRSVPMSNWQAAFTEVVGSTCNNQLVQFYYQNFIETNTSLREGGMESQEQWLDRGPILIFGFDKPTDDKSTEVNIQVTYSGAMGTATSFFLTAGYRKVAELTYSRGLISRVIVS